MTEWADLTPPDLAAFEKLAEQALLALPEPYRQTAMQIVLRIEDFADDGILNAMEIENPFELTGLYEGIPLTEKSVMDQPMGPDVIWLFRRAILEEWADRGNICLGHLIGHVLVHELAHHFGWSDADIAEIDPWWE